MALGSFGFLGGIARAFGVGSVFSETSAFVPPIFGRLGRRVLGMTLNCQLELSLSSVVLVALLAASGTGPGHDFKLLILRRMTNG